MAIIRTMDGKEQALTPERGLHLYRVLQGFDEPANEAVEKIASKTRKIYLNWRNAPDYYLLERKEALIPQVLGYWVRNKFGDYVRPDYDDEDTIRASTVLGLWEFGHPTAFVDKFNEKEKGIREIKLEKNKQFKVKYGR